MGAGGKVDPTKIKIADISKTYNCKLAQHIRKKLRKHDIREGVKVDFSTELPDKASLLYLPAAFGGAIASVAIRELIGKDV